MLSGSEIDTLKRLVAHHQSLVDWATLLVVIGLLGEICITFAYTKDKPRSEIILGVIATVIITLGVFGEYRFGSRAAAENSQLTAELTLEAQKAREHADNLELQIAARHVTLEQRKSMKAILGPGAGTTVSITFPSPAAPDAEEYAAEIEGIFREAEWDVLPYPLLTTFDAPFRPLHGFAVQARGQSPPKRSAVTQVTTALAVLDSRVTTIPYARTPANSAEKLHLFVFVGNK